MKPYQRFSSSAGRCPAEVGDALGTSPCNQRQDSASTLAVRRLASEPAIRERDGVNGWPCWCLRKTPKLRCCASYAGHDKRSRLVARVPNRRIRRLHSVSLGRLG